MIKLLWSGGRDSTFRLCQLLLVEKEQVQPIYIMNKKCLRLHNELNAIQIIKKKLLTKYPFTTDLLFNPFFYPYEAIQRNDEIKQKWNHLFDEYLVGSQYGYFARYAEQFNLNNLEPCLTNNTDRPVVSLIKPNVIGIAHDARLLDSCNHGLEIFKYFCFPTIHLSKKDMNEYSINHGFHDIMELTWSCFYPNGDEPCKKCDACLSLKKYGLGD